MDRRKSDRVKPVEQQRFSLKILDLTFDVKPENISAGGILLTAGARFPVSMMLEIELSYVDISATCMAQVWHRHGYSIGLEFVNPPERFRELISVATELAEPVTKVSLD